MTEPERTVPMARNTCKHCGDFITKLVCSECNLDLIIEKTCLGCHRELAHGNITIQNIHLCGNYHGELNDIDHDPDSYGMAD